ncbi:MAG TPA: matrixin family metalloprotease, partial [Polyangiaceae bacterium]|nr:matrixin family metalloprotease [Polyangiaceae bacterium]
MKTSAFLAAAGFALSVFSASSAFAFCRTTTCDPADPKQNCPRDENTCVTTGIPLAWRSSCVTIGVQQLGDPRDGFSFDDIVPVVQDAFSTWMNADCSGGKPSIEVNLIGSIECGLSEYNSKVGNANVVIFRTGKWPYTGNENAIGLTTTRFDTTNGDLWDADIELNADSMRNAHFSIGDPITGDDLLSVLTHEGGHFLGLSHSGDETATMKPLYNPSTDGATFRSLAPDDVAGICSIYPPGRRPATNSCTNRHGFSSQCGADQPAPVETKGCSLNTRTGVSGSAEHGSLSLFAVLAAACALRLARRRRVV